MRTFETGMKTKREDTGEDAWKATCAIRLCDYSCRIFEHARVRSRDIQYPERAKLFPTKSVPSPLGTHKGYIRLFRYCGSKELGRSKTIHVIAREFVCFE